MDRFVGVSDRLAVLFRHVVSVRERLHPGLVLPGENVADPQQVVQRGAAVALVNGLVHLELRVAQCLAKDPNVPVFHGEVRHDVMSPQVHSQVGLRIITIVILTADSTPENPAWCLTYFSAPS